MNVNATLNASIKTSTDEIGFYVTAEVIIAIFAFIGNLFVIFAVCKFKKLRTTTYYLLACLAFADICVAVIGIPSAIVLRIGLFLSDNSVEVLANNSGHGVVNKGFCFIMVSSVLFFTQASIFNLLIIAIDRFVAIYYPLRYRSIVTHRQVNLGIALAWVSGALIGFLPQISWLKDEKKTSDNLVEVNRCAFEEIISMHYMVYFNFFACVLLPLLAMFVLYFLIFRSVSQELRKIYSDVSRSRRSTFSNLSLVKGAKFLRPVVNQKLSTFCCYVVKEPEDNLRSIELLAMNINRTDHYDSRANSLQENEEDVERSCDPCRLPYEDHSFAVKPTKILRSSSTPEISMNHQPYYSLKRSKAKYFSTSDQLNGQSRRAGHSFLSISALCGPLERSNKPLISYDCERRIGSRDSRVTNKDDVVCSDDCSNVVEASRRNSIASSYVATRSDQAIENGRISRRKMKRKTQMLRKEFRAARSLFTVVGFFALCWLPLHIINCFTLFCPACRTPAFIKDFAILLSHANSLVNPIIYAFHLNDMKIAFQCIIKCSCSNFNSALNRQSLRKNYR